MITVDLLRDFLERVRGRASVDDHPLVEKLGALSGARGLGWDGEAASPSDQAVRKLGALWRQQFRPPVLNLEYRKGWNFYLLLEVMYFYPFAHGKPFPETLKHTAALLCDEEYLAHVIADGDPEQGGALVRDNAAFWAGFVPQAMTPAEQTIHSRRNAAVEWLAREINRQVALVGSLAEPVVPAPRIVESIKPPVAGNVSVGAELQAVENQPGSVAEPTGADRLRAAYAMSPQTARRQPAPFDPRVAAQSFLDRLVAEGPDLRPTQLDELALALWPLGFPQSFGVRRAVIDGVWWWNEEYYQQQLIETFRRTAKDQLFLQCASALRQSSLAVTIKDDAWLWPFGGSRWVPALEVVAQLAISYERGTGRHAVAVAVLARADHVMHLQGLGGDFEALGSEITSMLLTGGIDGRRDLHSTSPDPLPGSEKGGLLLP